MYKQEYIWWLGFHTTSLVISNVSLDKLLSFSEYHLYLPNKAIGLNVFKL